MKKSDWKKMIKIQLKKDIEKQTMKIEKTSSKMRHQKNQKYERQKYLGETGMKNAKEIVRTKLEMWDLGKNLGNDRKCICGDNEEIIEHILDCKKVKEILNDRDTKKEWITSGNTEQLMRVTKYIKGYIERRNVNILT